MEPQLLRTHTGTKSTHRNEARQLRGGGPLLQHQETFITQNMSKIQGIWNLPDALVVLAAPPGEERRAGAEAAQDAGASVLTAAATLLSTCRQKKAL